MRPVRVLLGVAVLAWVWLLSGCGRGNVPFVGNGSASKSASEERTLTAAHVRMSGIEVRTPVGSVEIVADPARTEVKVAAKITAFGETEEEARARLQEVKVTLNRRKDRVLEVAAEYSDNAKGIQGGCSFVIHIPEAEGVKVRTSNGSITLKGLADAADVDTGVGSIAITNQKGRVIAHTGNGSVRVTRVAGPVQATTSIGSLIVQEVTGDVALQTGNGSLEVRKAGGAVRCETSVGKVLVSEATGDVAVQSGNGSVELDQLKGVVQAKASIGSVTLKQAAGKVTATTGNGSINYSPISGSNPSFSLSTDIGPVNVRLPASAGGRIKATTSIGHITVTGSRQPRSVSGEKQSWEIVLTEGGPASEIHTGNGSIGITLE
jgi:hypothetical protein